MVRLQRIRTSSLKALCIALIAVFSVASVTAQTAKPTTEPAPPSTAPKAGEPPNVLVQLNTALEGLAAKVSPAVVQILVTGFGPVHEENRSQTALIVRQHAVG